MALKLSWNHGSDLEGPRSWPEAALLCVDRDVVFGSFAAPSLDAYRLSRV